VQQTQTQRIVSSCIDVDDAFGDALPRGLEAWFQVCRAFGIVGVLFAAATTCLASVELSKVLQQSRTGNQNDRGPDAPTRSQIVISLASSAGTYMRE